MVALTPFWLCQLQTWPIVSPFLLLTPQSLNFPLFPSFPMICLFNFAHVLGEISLFSETAGLILAAFFPAVWSTVSESQWWILRQEHMEQSRPSFKQAQL